ncbi:MAG TPA: hypothetical protein VE961_06170, partial [Pyrinomonadaceae bacterium]|nr:hypothetical protein [Pyrinomonadaceae bacterium]
MNRAKTNRTRTGWRWATAIALSLSLLTGIVVTEGAKAQSRSAEPLPASYLAKYTTDLTAAAQQGRFNSIEVPAESPNRAIEILSSQRKNPVVLSESQTVRDTVIIGVALRIAHNDVPEELLGTHLYKINLPALFHDTKTAEELTSTLSTILSEVSSTDARGILIIDPLQSLMGPSSAFDGAVSALLRDALKNSQVHCFGASTEVAFQQNVAKDESLAALFSPVETEAASQKTDESVTSDQAAINEPFVGDKVSPELRELLANASVPARVHAVLQVKDANSESLRREFSEYGIKIESEIPRFGAVAVDMPTK